MANLWPYLVYALALFLLVTNVAAEDTIIPIPISTTIIPIPISTTYASPTISVTSSSIT
jgi:hypothetical protein